MINKKMNARKDAHKQLVFIIKKYCKIKFISNSPKFGRIFLNLISLKNKKRILFTMDLFKKEVSFSCEKKQDSFKINNRLFFNVDKWLYRNTL